VAKTDIATSEITRPHAHRINSPSSQLLVSSVLAGIKMDHLCMDRYVFNEKAEKLEAPLWLIGGLDDPRSPPEQLPEWDRYTTCSIQIKTFPGGHFFLKEKEADVLAWLGKVIEE